MEPPQIRFGVDIWEEGVYDRFARCVLQVEKLGFDSTWAAEAHDLDLLIKLTVAAAKTSNVKLGTVVLVPALRYPFMLAKTLTSLDIVSRGRLILGVGCSDQPSIGKRGVPSDNPVSRMLESIRILRKLWTEDSVTFKGHFYQINYSLPLKPIQKPHPPIWIAGGGPRMSRIIATYADGWIGMPTHDRYETLLKKIRRSMKEKGRDPAGLEPAVLAFTSIASNHDTAEEWSRGHEAPIVGTPDEYIGGIEKLVKSGARHFILAFYAPDEKEYLNSLILCAQKVIPYFREQDA